MSLTCIKRAMLVMLLGIAQAHAASFYALSLEWPLDSAYQLDVRDQWGGQVGITVTPVLQFDGRNRQTVIVVPPVALCTQQNRQFQLAVTALMPTQPALLTISAERETLYQQSVSDSLAFELPPPDDSSCPNPADDIIGELTVAVAIPSSASTLSWSNLLREDVGHAWIEFRALSPKAPLAYGTAGTYSSVIGNNVANGINFFREIYRPAAAYKTVAINSAQWVDFSRLIENYMAQGAAAWTPWHNCTQFAIDAWYAVTQETLSATRTYPDAPWEVTQMHFPNTVSLYYSIVEHGGIQLANE